MGPSPCIRTLAVFCQTQPNNKHTVCRRRPCRYAASSNSWPHRSTLRLCAYDSAVSRQEVHGAMAKDGESPRGSRRNGKGHWLGAPIQSSNSEYSPLLWIYFRIFRRYALSGKRCVRRQRDACGNFVNFKICRLSSFKGAHRSECLCCTV